jgi:hypothetical protein
MYDLAWLIYPTIAGLFAGLTGIALADFGAARTPLAGTRLRGSALTAARPQPAARALRGEPSPGGFGALALQLCPCLGGFRGILRS